MPRMGLLVFAVGMLAISGCGPRVVGEGISTQRNKGTEAASPDRVIEIPNAVAAKIVEGARAQLVKPARYDASYRSIKYPGGDVAADRGACTDVVIRALRHAGYDLQKLIHEDMKAHFSSYPRRGDRTDTNIDHRRVPNQRYFFTKFGSSLGVSTSDPKAWKPGDIVTWKLDSGLDHTGVVVDEKGSSGFPLVVHNLGVTAMEDVLTAWKITGHYRYPK